MKIRTVLVDMDEVLADFTGAALQVHGLRREEFEGRRTPGRWDICEGLGISHDEFWDPIHALGESFWTAIQPLPWFRPLLDVLNSYNWYVVSSPARSPWCLSGKFRWLRQHVDPKFGRYVFTQHKYLMANPETLLIDDSENNLQLFRQAGGRTILFPSWGNHLHVLASDPVPFIQESLDALNIPKCESRLLTPRA